MDGPALQGGTILLGDETSLRALQWAKDSVATAAPADAAQDAEMPDATRSNAKASAKGTATAKLVSMDWINAARGQPELAEKLRAVEITDASARLDSPHVVYEVTGMVCGAAAATGEDGADWARMQPQVARAGQPNPTTAQVLIGGGGAARDLRREAGEQDSEKSIRIFAGQPDLRAGAVALAAGIKAAGMDTVELASLPGGEDVDVIAQNAFTAEAAAASAATRVATTAILEQIATDLAAKGCPEAHVATVLRSLPGAAAGFMVAGSITEKQVREQHGSMQALAMGSTADGDPVGQPGAACPIFSDTAIQGSPPGSEEHHPAKVIARMWNGEIPLRSSDAAVESTAARVIVYTWALTVLLARHRIRFTDPLNGVAPSMVAWPEKIQVIFKEMQMTSSGIRDSRTNKAYIGSAYSAYTDVTEVGDDAAARKDRVRHLAQLRAEVCIGHRITPSRAEFTDNIRKWAGSVDTLADRAAAVERHIKALHEVQQSIRDAEIRVGESPLADNTEAAASKAKPGPHRMEWALGRAIEHTE